MGSVTALLINRSTTLAMLVAFNQLIGQYMHYITPIPALKDNYIWMVISSISGHCIIVDPGEHQCVIETVMLHQIKPVAIFVTHHHADHTNGVSALSDYFKVPVFGSAYEHVSGVTHPVEGGEIIEIKAVDLTFNILFIPGHTRGHIAYYTSQGFIFTGDTLFTAACGRLFEGTAMQMHNSLSKIAGLPDHTLIYCGHEYTENNLKFAQHIEPGNQVLHSRIKMAAQLRKHGIPTVPAPLSLEKQTNPFLRCREEAVIRAAEKHEGRKLLTECEVFESIRRQKDCF
jgi:hydroxyacylglutathione hydrolase